MVNTDHTLDKMLFNNDVNWEGFYKLKINSTNKHKIPQITKHYANNDRLNDHIN